MEAFTKIITSPSISGLYRIRKSLRKLTTAVFSPRSVVPETYSSVNEAARNEYSSKDVLLEVLTLPFSCVLCGCCVVRFGQVLYLGFNRITDISALCLERMPYLLAVDLQVMRQLFRNADYFPSSNASISWLICVPVHLAVTTQPREITSPTWED